MKRIAIFPGSYDPFTIGHLDLVERIHSLFDQVIVAIGHNSKKKYRFPLEQRLKWIEKSVQHLDNVSADSFEGLTTDYCQQKGAKYLLRGLRSAADLDFEQTIAQLNRELTANDPVETIFLGSQPKYSHISSTIVREILLHRGKVHSFLPEVIARQVVAANDNL